MMTLFLGDNVPLLLLTIMKMTLTGRIIVFYRPTLQTHFYLWPLSGESLTSIQISVVPTLGASQKYDFRFHYLMKLLVVHTAKKILLMIQVLHAWRKLDCLV